MARSRRASADAVIDAATLVQPLIALIRDGGVYVDFRQSEPVLERGIRHAGVMVHTDGALLRRLVEHVDAGSLKLAGIDRRPLTDVASAQRDFDTGGIRDRLILTP